MMSWSVILCILIKYGLIKININIISNTLFSVVIISPDNVQVNQGGHV